MQKCISKDEPKKKYSEKGSQVEKLEKAKDIGNEDL